MRDKYKDQVGFNYAIVSFENKDLMLTKETKLLKDKLLSKSQKGTHLQSQQSYTLSIGYICFEKIQPIIKNIIEDRFKNITCIKIKNCDLRSVINFPRLPQLTDLDLSKNSLQGNFQPLLKNTRIMYFDISKNMISKLEALKTMKQIAPLKIYAYSNPLLPLEGKQQTSKKAFQIQIRLKLLGITLLKEPEPKKVKNVEAKKQAVQKQVEQKDRDHHPFPVHKKQSNLSGSSIFRALHSGISKYASHLRDNDLNFQQKKSMFLQYLRQSNHDQNKVKQKKPMVLSSCNQQFSYVISPQSPSQLQNNLQRPQRFGQNLQSEQVNDDEQIPNDDAEQSDDHEEYIPNQDGGYQIHYVGYHQAINIDQQSEAPNDDDSIEMSDNL